MCTHGRAFHGESPPFSLHGNTHNIVIHLRSEPLEASFPLGRNSSLVHHAVLSLTLCTSIDVPASWSHSLQMVVTVTLGRVPIMMDHSHELQILYVPQASRGPSL